MYGSDCKFIEADGFGFKLYRTKAARNMSFVNQSVLSRLDAAPKCWDPFECTVRVTRTNGSTTTRPYWGFVTELAYRIDKEVYYSASGGVAHYSYYVAVNDQLAALKTRLRDKYGIHWCDTNYFNTGIVDGRLVLIDCCEGLLPDLVKSSLYRGQLL